MWLRDEKRSGGIVVCKYEPYDFKLIVVLRLTQLLASISWDIIMLGWVYGPGWLAAAIQPRIIALKHSPEATKFSASGPAGNELVLFNLDVFWGSAAVLPDKQCCMSISDHSESCY